MPHAQARAQALPVAGTDDRTVPHTVLVLQRALENVSDDLHVPMGMHGEALAGLYPVFV